MSRLTHLTELRRALPLVAAALLLVAIALPMWRITLEAPQYPDGMFVELYAYPRLEGDVSETQGLNQYVGFYYPDPVYLDPNYDVHPRAIEVPEWSVGPLAFVAVAAAGVFVAFAPTVRKLKLGLTCQLVGTITVFAGMFALIQYRLHQAGHALDPDAPMRGIDPFTPPLLGTYEIANISGVAWFGPGGYLTALALVLVVTAFLLRNSDATVDEIPALVADVSALVGAGRRSSADDSSDRPTDETVSESPPTAEADATAMQTENDATAMQTENDATSSQTETDAGVVPADGGESR
ncbi:hypothetical protein [Natrarchaeobius chitinivorans]|uniref:hypothetical protein n=1 Tax=Natrarchaeobius chitinivorans TaxID=1679083 RepID=UPI001FB29386|nr:hypothetical protein [Natrarchaeobius chitinivorans]